MLRLVTGKAGAGKTGAIMGEIAEAVRRGEGRRLLIVPEQYSHEAERELCRRCGDSMSLYAEVFSFTGLARHMRSRLGGGAAPCLDKGGRLLCMALALKNIGQRLKVYPAARHRAELQAMLLQAVDELKSAAVSADALLAAAERWDDSLGDKLADLALILEGYDAVTANGRADPADALTVLAEQIERSDIDRDTYIYVDGFIDFTAQERQVLLSLLRKGAQLCVCLTLDGVGGDSEIFALSRRAARALLRSAEELGTESRTETVAELSGKHPQLGFFADNMFSWSAVEFAGEGGAISLYRAQSMAAECELAAARALELVRGGSRWRDISVAARGFEDYRGALESAFRHYGAPLYTARRSDMLSKPLPSMIQSAYEIILDGWDVDDVAGYMRTGLTGLDSEQCDLLESYIFKWQLRGSAWKRRGQWRQHPEGYGAEYDEETEERLQAIDRLRKRLAGPLLRFQERTEAAQTADGHARALSALLEELELPQTLALRAQELERSGRETAAAEYRQLWELTVSALEQCEAVLGDASMDGREFGKLLTLVLSQYDVGTIPVSLDRVSAGDFDRNRRREIKHLIVLGCSDDRLPKGDDGGGIFSQDEKQRLLEADVEIGPGGEDELWREFSLIYNTLTLPSESLTLCCPMQDGDGGELRAAFVLNRAAALFALEAKQLSLRELRMTARSPALGLAAAALRGGRAGQGALEYFTQTEPERISALRRAAEMTRGSLSRGAVEKLYGKKLRLSASRIDKFAACRFAYFCQYGLRAKPYEPALFKPPEIGSFMHYVLENTAREAKRRGGFKAIDDGTLREMTDGFVQKYAQEELGGFQEKSPRFIYLFKRLGTDVYQVVRDMAEELRRSDFEPLDFELDFSKAQDIPPIELGEGQEGLTLTGIADRVDGWAHDGKLYLRIVDYKTGKKAFSLSDIWYGMGLQMLLYLFALSDDGARRYGADIVPAGVMYVPAREPLLSMPGPAGEAEIDALRAESRQRSGLVLDDEALKEAWERGDEKRYIPIKLRRGKASEDSVASLERLGKLERHIKRKLGDMASELRSGSISADPYYRSQQENACLSCDYFDACHFSEGENGERSRYMPRLSPDKVWARLEGGGTDE